MEKNMIIRNMTIDDYDVVYSLWMSCVGMGLNNLDDSKEGIEKFIHRNPETCLVAVSDSEIIGVIMVGNDGRRGYIYHTAVNPDFRKQGIAKKLVDSAMSELSALGINKVALVVFDRNETGNAFWESQGFTVRNDLVYRNKALAEIVRIDTKIPI
jgi:ribosomal protein S18 acetylase RimI-like enzyme